MRGPIIRCVGSDSVLCIKRSGTGGFVRWALGRGGGLGMGGVGTSSPSVRSFVSKEVEGRGVRRGPLGRRAREIRA